MVRLSLAGVPKPFVEVSSEHYARLSALHAKHAQSADGALSSRALCLLLRYQSLGAHGFQCALPARIFEVLRERLGVTLEAFASPLNATHLEGYCSAFGDVDAHFGSLGSFFDFHPSEGSFEANPPFVPEVMLKAVEHAEALLQRAEAAGRALSFCFVVPAWETLPFWQRLCTTSPWRGRASDPIQLDADAHAYVDGAAHLKSEAADRLRPSSFGTTIVALQTSAAAQRWPCDAALRGELVAAFRESLPSESELKKRTERGGVGKGDAVARMMKRRKV